MSAKHNISPQDYELLSTYIDGELSDPERSALELRLANEPFLQSELSSLRATVDLIHQLQSVTAPHDFTLTEEMIASAKVIQFKPSRPHRVGYLSLVASFVVMIFGVIFMVSEIERTQATSQFSAESSDQVEIASAPTAPETLSNVQNGRVQEETVTIDSGTRKRAEDAPDEGGASLNMQAPMPPEDESLSNADTDTALNSVTLDDADDIVMDSEAPPLAGIIPSEDTNFAGNGDDDVGDAQILDNIAGEDTVGQGTLQSVVAEDFEETEVLGYVEAPSVEANLALTVDGFSIETQAFDDITLNEAEEQDISGGSLAEPEALSDSTTTSNEEIESDDRQDELSLEARDNDVDVGQEQLTSTPSDIPSEPQAPQTLKTSVEDTTPSPFIGGFEIGVGLVIIAILMFGASLFLIVRNRS